MQSNHRSPHCHPRNVHDYSCVVTLVASPVRFLHLPPPEAPYGSPSPKFRPRFYRNIEDTNLACIVNTPWAPVPFIPFMTPVPLPTKSAPFPWLSGIHKVVIVDGRYASCPYSLRLLVSLQATTIYRRAVAHTTTYASDVFCS